ncbi:hypothetical protein PtB15_3B435 [Puccinia triticina]|nr:hypothetical protein PtB15_3B435 [Puccinia triticina]
MSINSFISFAKQYNICLAKEKPDEYVPIPISDVYQDGINVMKEDFKNCKGGLDRLKPSYMFDQDMDVDSANADDSNDSDWSKDSSATDDSDNSQSSNTSESSGTSDNSD